MTADPPVSVVIPVRNGARHLLRAIGSVLSQSFVDFRLHILENSSSDQTPDILADLDDPRITIHPSDVILPIEDNWRRINELDLQEFLTVLSHDDILYPDFLKEVLGLIVDNPSATLFQTHFDIIDDRERRLRSCRPIPLIESAEEFLRARHQRRRDSFGTGYVTRSLDFRAVGGFPRLPGLIYSDDLLWFRIALLGGKVCSPRTLFAYRQRETSVSRSVGLEDLYVASKEYLGALSRAGYALNRRNATLARRFVEQSYRGRTRWVILDLLRSGDGRAIRSFQETLRTIVARARGDRLFSPVDAISWLSGRLVALPLPGRVRKVLAQSLVCLAGAVRSARRVVIRSPGGWTRE